MVPGTRVNDEKAKEWEEQVFVRARCRDEYVKLIATLILKLRQYCLDPSRQSINQPVTLRLYIWLFNSTLSFQSSSTEQVPVVNPPGSNADFDSEDDEGNDEPSDPYLERIDQLRHFIPPLTELINKCERNQTRSRISPNDVEKMRCLREVLNGHRRVTMSVLEKCERALLQVQSFTLIYLWFTICL